LQRAIDVLNVLTKEHADSPDYRYLLALCEREIAPREAIPRILETIQLLTELVKQYPGVADYRYELASSLSMFDVREVQRPDYPLAEQRLRAALVQSTQLVDAHPYAPDYALLHVHVLNKLSRILRHPPERHEDGPGRLGEAAELYEQAIRRQINLSARFPNDRVHHFWLAKLRESQARLMLQRGQEDKARGLMQTAITDFEPLLADVAEAPSFTFLAADLYRTLGDVLHELGEDEPSQEAHRKSRSLRSPPP
jgi:tetratricopeptide (TPR) repeat protein